MSNSFHFSTDSLHLSQRIPETIRNLNNPLSQLNDDGLIALSSLEQSRSDSRFFRSSMPSMINRKKNFEDTKKFQRKLTKSPTLKKNRQVNSNLVFIDCNFDQKNIPIGKGRIAANRLVKIFKDKQFFTDYRNLKEYHFGVFNDLSHDKNEVKKRRADGKMEYIFRRLLPLEFKIVDRKELYIRHFSEIEL